MLDYTFQSLKKHIFMNLKMFTSRAFMLPMSLAPAVAVC